MSTLAGQKRKRTPLEPLSIERTPLPRHPYLTGNFAPIQQTLPLTACSFTGTIPTELAGGEYVRNGSNPVTNEDLGRDAHWFDGDGMLSGVSFHQDADTGEIQPEFVNQFVLTDLHLSAISSDKLRVPILPSIATLVNPLASIIYVTLRILRTVLLVLLSHLPGSRQKIKKISVANTNIVYHDGRTLATCESGPPMRIHLPGLETVGWYNGAWVEGEPAKTQDIDEGARGQKHEKVLGGDSRLLSFMREWTTAHPKVDPHTHEMLMFHSSFAPPYVQYSIIPKTHPPSDIVPGNKSTKFLNVAVPGVHGAKMMHDFGVSTRHTVIMDLPLTLDPMNQLRGLPPVSYDATKPSRFGVFPRRQPDQVRWFETDASCIFHTANTWDNLDECSRTVAVNMLACRLTSATLVYASGNIAPPVPPQNNRVFSKKRRMPFFSRYNHQSEETIWEQAPLLESPIDEKEAFIVDTYGTEDVSSIEDPFLEEQCRLYYYSFSLDPAKSSNTITHQWALSALPFEFPSVRADREMSEARYVYGCSTTTTTFGSALGKATKIDALVKVDTGTLIARGCACPPKNITGVVDKRSMEEVLSSTDPNDPIRVFRLPTGWYGQEPRFVPAKQKLPSACQSGSENEGSEDDEDNGYLIFYAFDESQLLSSGDVPPDSAPSNKRATSELWIVNAKDMQTIIARVRLPQRVPYGLHGSWFSAKQIASQRPVETFRSVKEVLARERPEKGVWAGTRRKIEGWLG